MTTIARRATICLAACLVSMPLYAAAAPADRLDEVLRQMDEASARFKSAEADLRKESYERVVKDTTTETGSVYFVRKGASTEMGLKMNPPNARFVEYRNGVGRIFDPGANHLTEARSAQYESFLTLGFGGRGTDLKNAWTVTDQGTEQLSDGSGTVAVEKLDLVAKDAGVRNTFSHITMWVDPARSVLLKQQFFSPSGDIYTSTYTHIRYNQKVDTTAYAIKANKTTTIDRR